MLLPRTVQRLRKLAPVPKPLPLEVKHVDRARHEDRQACEYRARVLEVVPAADVLVQRGGVVGGDAGEEISSEGVAASGRGGVGAVGGDHVVDGGHVDCVVCDGDKAGENERRNPGDAVGGAERGPGETEEANGLERGRKEEPEKATLGGEGFRGTAAGDAVAVDKGKEREVADYVAGQDGAEAEALLPCVEVPLLEDGVESLKEGKDEGV